MGKNQTKGKALEQLVRKIESHILLNNTGIEPSNLTISTNKIFNVDGVRCEIDVWVEIDHGSGYRNAVAFECKNWEEKVGPKEISWFASKVEKIQASKGYFIAKAYTSNAHSEAKKSPRIELLLAKFDDSMDQPVPFGMHMIMPQNDIHSEVHFRARAPGKTKSAEPKRLEMNFETVTADLGGKPLDLNQYLRDWSIEVAQAGLSEFPSTHLPSGTHQSSMSQTRSFKSGELTLDGIEIREIEIKTRRTVQVVQTKVKQSASIESRADLLELEPAKINDDIELEIGFIRIHDDGPPP